MREYRIKKIGGLSLIAILALLCVIATCWIYTQEDFNKELIQVVSEKTKFIELKAKKIKENIDKDLNHLKGLPEVYAQNEQVKALLFKSGPQKSDAYLNTLNAELLLLTKNLNITLLWVLDAKGNCIATSNYLDKDSLLNKSFSDRKYFKAGVAGAGPYTYMVGKITGIAGLFFGAPIVKDGVFQGMVVSKIDLDNVRYLTAQTDSFVSDENGVIIMSNNKNEELMQLENATIDSLTPDERQRYYRKINFPVFKIKATELKDQSIFTLNNEKEPAVLVKIPLEKLKGIVHAYAKLPELKSLNEKRIKNFWLGSMLGTIAIVLLWSSAIYVIAKKTAAFKLSRSLSLLSSTMEATADGILVINKQNEIVNYNKKLKQILRREEDLSHKQDVFYMLETILKSAEALALIKEDLNTATPVEKKYSFELKNGSFVDVVMVPQVVNETLMGHVLSFKDVTELRKIQAEIYKLAYTDSLTELPNRRRLIEELQSMYEQDTDSHNILVFVDLDEFKLINDTYGHEIGDLLLQAISDRVTNTLKESDMCARLGGDEFVIVLKNAGYSKESAMGYAKSKIDELQACLNNSYVFKDIVITATCSIGLKYFSIKKDSKHNLTLDQVMRSADAAMYQSKKTGKNKLTICS